MIDVISLIQTLGGIVGGFGFGMFTKSGRVKSQADAYKAMAEAYEYRIESLHKVIDTNNKTEAEHSQRIADLNHALNVKEDEILDKKKQIRSLTEKMYQAETEVNRVNAELIEAQKAIAELRVEMEKKRCDDLPCPFRRPPNAHTPANTGGQTREEYAKTRDINLNKE